MEKKIEKRLEETIIIELLKKEYIGHAYLPIQRFLKKFPSDKRGAVKKVIGKLIRENIILTTKKECISLNIKNEETKKRIKIIREKLLRF